ncbi:MAG TPA: hypothetical protein VKZ54_11210, partial [Membranihabitans sp.]|nr:hypothetical protein [Membranihabitans sp.]
MKRIFPLCVAATLITLSFSGPIQGANDAEVLLYLPGYSPHLLPDPAESELAIDINGTVTDQEGEVLIGVNIQVKGT